MKIIRQILVLCVLCTFNNLKAQSNKVLQPYVLMVQPIVVQSDLGKNGASMALPEALVDYAYSNAGIDFHFLEPIFYNNTEARDGLINLDEIVVNAKSQGIIRGQNDIVNMFFVNKVDGKSGPLGRGMFGGNITFITLGEEDSLKSVGLKYMQAFVIAHEVGHNLSLNHAVDDPNVSDTLPNIQGDGNYKDRINPKYSLNDYQIELIHKSGLVHKRVEFLSKSKGEVGILDETFEPYFSQLQKREIEAFTHTKVPFNNLDDVRGYAKVKFSEAVTNFTTDEKECIQYVIDEVNKTMLNNGISLMANHPWRFIKVKDWLCGGFAHTRGTFIILSEKHINYLSKGWSANMTEEDKTKLVVKFGSLLVHEQMHSLQRTYKSKFVKLYTEYWSFVQGKVQAEHSIIQNQVSNPDAPIAEWLIPDLNESKTYYWIRTLLKESNSIPEMGKDFEDIVFRVEKSKGIFTLKNNENGNLSRTLISELEFYNNAFPTKRGLDHPNEISAYMFSDYFKSLYSGEKPFSDIEQSSILYCQKFMSWIKKEMGSK